jgi:hypothetical protein
MTMTTAQAAPDALAPVAGQTVQLVQSVPPMWITYLSALLVPAIAALAVAVAVAQWRIARNKLKLELFERRHSVYVATLEAINRIISSEEPDANFIERFQMGTAGVKWLFGPEVAEFVWDELAPIVHGYGALRTEHGWDSLPPERQEWLQKATLDLHKLGHTQLSRIDAVFDKYLKLSH